MEVGGGGDPSAGLKPWMGSRLPGSILGQLDALGAWASRFLLFGRFRVWERPRGLCGPEGHSHRACGHQGSDPGAPRPWL